MKKSKGIWREVGWGLGVLLICILLLAMLAGNLYGMNMKFAAIPYLVRGYPQGDVLLIGSSYMEYWESSAADLGPVHTRNVGVAGTKAEQWTKEADKLIFPFHPRAIVLYMGSNDIDGSENSKTGEEEAKLLEELLDVIEEGLPGTPVYYLSITPTPKRWNAWPEQKICNQLMGELAQRRETLTFINCEDAILDENGELQEELYRSDRLHFNEKGYEVWTSVIRPVILNDLAEEAEK